MENTRFVKIIAFIILAVLFTTPLFVNAYKIPVHRNLTYETFKIYNNIFGKSFSSQEIAKAIQGSAGEDDGNRSLRHFYDPVNNKGLSVVKTWIASKKWAQDTDAQSRYGKNTGFNDKYFSNPDDYSWDRAVYEYAHGDKGRAIESLGHILHLIQDSTVPAHVRNDDHLSRLGYGDISLYEEFTANQDVPDSLIIVSDVPVFTNLNGYFDNVAKFANENFLSKDTIFEEYDRPDENLIDIWDSVEILGDIYLFGYSDYGKLVALEKEQDFFGRVKKEKYIINDPNNLILTDYWNALSKQAVVNGVGVIKLFFEEVEKEKKTLALKNKNKSKAERQFANIRSSGFSLIKGLYGSSLTNDDIEELMDNSQAVVVILAVEESAEIAELTRESTRRVDSLVNSEEEADIEAITTPQIPPEQAATTSPQASQVRQDAPAPLPAYQQTFPALAGYSPGFGGGMPAPASPPPTPSAQNTATSSDTTAPDISLTVSECQNSLSNTGCLTATTTLNILWSSTAGDLDYFVIDNNGSVSTTTATSTIAAASDNSVYSFSISARDTSGNFSATSTKQAEISTMPVIINEVAWMGNQSNSYDEWIELYNRTAQSISLDSWTLYAQDGVPYINLSGTISSNDYYLIEWTDDNTVNDISADLIYGNDGSDWELNNTGEILYLTRASTTIDQTILNGNQWPGGLNASSINRLSMERYDTDVAGTVLSNWGTNITTIKNGKNADDIALKATPKSRNSVNYLIAKGQSSISSNETLTKSNSPYFVDNILQTFQSGSSLSIEPGVAVKFYNDAGLKFTANSAISAPGTAGDQIIFTSFYDDDYGGDTNNDATSTAPSAGDWFGIQIDSATSTFDNAIFRYGGKYYNGQSQSRANLSVEGISSNITNSIFEYSKIYGLKLSLSDAAVSGNTFRNNNQSVDPAGIGSAIYIVGGSPTVQNNSVTQNGRGLYLSGSTAIVSSNIFSSNSNEAIYSSGALGAFSSNSASDNNINGIVISGTLTSVGATTTMLASSLPYVLKTYDATIIASSTLKIANGVVIKGSGAGLLANGSLIIDGNNSGDVMFTSLYDDSAGGDTTGDATSTSPSPGQWEGFTISSTGSLNAKGFTMRYAGGTASYSSQAAGLTIDSVSVAVSNALFSNNYPHGLKVSNSENITIENSKFENHTYSGSWGTKAALAVSNSTTTLTSVLFENNLLGVIGDAISNFIISAVTFINNTATTSPSGLW